MSSINRNIDALQSAIAEAKATLRDMHECDGAVADLVSEALAEPWTYTTTRKAHVIEMNMDDWHTCETTHCRAGWVVTLAGKEGRELEEETSCAFAAMQIYRKSSEIHVPPTRFYEPNQKAMADIVRCAELEKASKDENIVL